MSRVWASRFRHPWAVGNLRFGRSGKIRSNCEWQQWNYFLLRKKTIRKTALRGEKTQEKHRKNLLPALATRREAWSIEEKVQCGEMEKFTRYESLCSVWDLSNPARGTSSHREPYTPVTFLFLSARGARIAPLRAMAKIVRLLAQEGPQQLSSCMGTGLP